MVFISICVIFAWVIEHWPSYVPLHCWKKKTLILLWRRECRKVIFSCESAIWEHQDKLLSDFLCPCSIDRVVECWKWNKLQQKCSIFMSLYQFCESQAHKVRRLRILMVLMLYKWYTTCLYKLRMIDGFMYLDNVRVLKTNGHWHWQHCGSSSRYLDII